MLFALSFRSHDGHPMTGLVLLAMLSDGSIRGTLMRADGIRGLLLMIS